MKGNLAKYFVVAAACYAGGMITDQYLVEEATGFGTLEKRAMIDSVQVEVGEATLCKSHNPCSLERDRMMKLKYTNGIEVTLFDAQRDGKVTFARASIDKEHAQEAYNHFMRKLQVTK